MTDREPGGPGGEPSAGVVRTRSAWSLADQIVSSAANLAVLVVVARTAAVEEVGAFALAFSAYQLLLAITRPLNTDPLLVRFSASSPGEQRAAGASALGGSVFLGLLIAPVGLATWAVVGGSTGRTLLALGACAAIFLLQDAWRLLFLTMGRPRMALANDVVVLVALVPSVMIFHRALGETATASVLAWAAATFVAAVVGAIQAGVLPRADKAIDWWRRTGALGTRMLGENVVAMAAYLIALAGIARVGGVPALGRLRTAQVAIAVSHPLIIAAGVVITTEGSRFGSAKRVRRLVVLVGLATTGATLLVTLFWHLVPDSLGRRILGSGWSGAKPLLLGAGLFAVGVGLTTVVSAGLRAVRAPGEALRCRLVAAPLSVGAAFWGTTAGPEVAVVAMAAVEGACACAMWRRFHTRREAVEPAESLVLPA